MLIRLLKTAIITFLCNTLVYMPLLRAEQLSLPGGDLVAPEITQDVYKQTVSPGSDHEIMVRVTDDVGVEQVTLYFRVIGQPEYKHRTMQQVAESDNYQASVRADEIKSPGIEYYIQAMDIAGNTLLHGYEFSPLSVKLESTSGESRLADSTEPTMFEAEPDQEKKGVSKWVWIGLGVLALGALAAAGGSSGGGDSGDTGTATLNVTAPEPAN